MITTRGADDEYRRVWWQPATLLVTKLIYTPKKIEQNEKSTKKNGNGPVDLGRKTKSYRGQRNRNKKFTTPPQRAPIRRRLAE